MLLRTVLVVALVSPLVACGKSKEAVGVAPRASAEDVKPLTARLIAAADEHDDRFARALPQLEGWPAPGEEPCPHDIPSPSAAAASGESPLQAASTHHGQLPMRSLDAGGESPRESEIGRAIRQWASNLLYPGAKLEHLRREVDAQLEAPLRFELLYRRDEFRAPIFEAGRDYYKAGVSAGRAYLFDHSEGRFVCAADIRVSSGTKLLAGEATGQAALNIQLRFAELRAFATSARALPQLAEAP